jgi:hypothetical protein
LFYFLAKKNTFEWVPLITMLTHGGIDMTGQQTNQLATIPPQGMELAPLTTHYFSTDLLLIHVPDKLLDVFRYGNKKSLATALYQILHCIDFPFDCDESLCRLISEADRLFGDQPPTNESERNKWFYVWGHLIRELDQTLQEARMTDRTWVEPEPGCWWYMLDVAEIQSKQMLLLRRLKYVVDKIKSKDKKSRRTRIQRLSELQYAVKYYIDNEWKGITQQDVERMFGLGAGALSKGEGKTLMMQYQPILPQKTSVNKAGQDNFRYNERR